MQVGPGCSDIPYWPGTFSSPLRYLRDIPEQIMFKISGFSQIPKQSLRSFQIFSDFSDLFRSFSAEDLDFLHHHGPSLWAFGSCFQCPEHPGGAPCLTSRCSTASRWAARGRSWCGDPNGAMHRCLGASVGRWLWVFDPFILW